MSVLLTNNGFSTLASGITDVATSLTVATLDGALFPTLAGSDYFYATLINTSNQLEIIKVTARSTDTFTIERGAESTTARAFSAGDRVELRLTAAALGDRKDNTETLTNKTIAAGSNTLTDVVTTIETENLTVGYTTDLNAIGNSGTGTQTVSLILECLQTLTINGSFTLAPPSSGNGIAIIYATNDGTGGYTMTTSGFTKVTGTYNSAAAAVNRLQVEKVGALTTLIITDLTP